MGRYWEPITRTQTAGTGYEKNLHVQIKDEFVVWRLILEKVATLSEIETLWSLDDVMRANALLDMKSDIAEVERRKQARHDSR